MKKKETKSINRNEVAIEGTVQKVHYSSDKCICFTLEVVNEKTHLWLKTKQFNPESEVDEGDKVSCLGYLVTESSEYKGKKKYETVLVATDITE